MNASVPCSRLDCLNKGLLLIDADSVLFLLNGTVMYVLSNYPDVKTWDRRLSIIKEELTKHLDRLTRCTLDGKLYTSESILHEELDIVRASTSIKKWLRGSPFGRLHENHRRAIQQVLREYLIPIPVTDEVKKSFRLRFNESIRPKDRDATLLVAACELADSGARTLVVAHNHDYEGPVAKLRHNGEILLVGGRVLSTTTLERWTYENFLLVLNDSCCIDQGRCKALGYGFITPQEDRTMLDKRLTLVIKKNIIHEVRLFRDELDRSIENKIRHPCTPAWQVS